MYTAHDAGPSILVHLADNSSPTMAIPPRPRLIRYFFALTELKDDICTNYHSIYFIYRVAQLKRAKFPNQPFPIGNKCQSDILSTDRAFILG